MSSVLTPVTTIGGFLGAGKTTLINALLKNAQGCRLAILVNEFGELSIDEDLIEAQDGNIISLAGGCVCCAFGDDLSGALAGLVATQSPPDHILIEASGVAIPSSIAASLGIMRGFQQNGIVVLADADDIQNLLRDRYMGDTVQRQLRDADLVVVTKTDLVDNAHTDALITSLRALAPDAEVIRAANGAIPLEVVIGPRPGVKIKQSHSTAQFTQKLHAYDCPVDAEEIAAGLAQNTSIIRAKGFVPDNSGQTMLIQVVGKRYQVSAQAPRASHVVVSILSSTNADCLGNESMTEDSAPLLQMPVT